ncbi:MAG: HPr family phosphocarrier protein [Anaerobutyricum sp.]|jgi:phosphotransferase system HPr-like phosphotransfer protein|nr:HPr family phosphocarrier protein [Anaerobutyricum sp.]
MTRFIKLTEANDLRDFMVLATRSPYEIGVHTDENQIADAKSILGLMALDYSKPVRVVTEDEKFLQKLDRWAVDETITGE